ncbi:MAG: MgtC/SapB family protein [Anaerolineales bacterium]|jgi:putative Mg2+ transporter-C (MgtC) family protein
MNSIEIVIKLLLALLAGGLIGAEREFHDKTAGFRTMTFICVGATLFTILSLEMGSAANDPVRIAASIVTGIGFIGAGVILRREGHITGLTTASTIWIVAALGMAIGGGYYVVAGIVIALIMAGLWIFPLVDRLIHKTRETRTYHIVFSSSEERYQELENFIYNCGLKTEYCNRGIQHDDMICTWRVHGLSKDHEHLVDKLFIDEHLKVFQY